MFSAERFVPNLESVISKYSWLVLAQTRCEQFYLNSTRHKNQWRVQMSPRMLRTLGESVKGTPKGSNRFPWCQSRLRNQRNGGWRRIQSVSNTFIITDTTPTGVQERATTERPTAKKPMCCVRQVLCCDDTYLHKSRWKWPTLTNQATYRGKIVYPPRRLQTLVLRARFKSAAFKRPIVNAMKITICVSGFQFYAVIESRNLKYPGTPGK